jgi:hypothetical protein
MDRDVRLLTIVKDAVFRIVLDSGIDPSEFRWIESEVEDVSRHGAAEYAMSTLQHSSGYFYRFGAYTDTFSPGESSRIAIEDISYFREKWNQRLNIVYNWLGFLKREIEAPDLWQSILDEKQLMQIAWAPTHTNTRFTPEEKQYCIQEFGEIRQRLKSVHRLQIEQAEIMDQGFAYILDAMERFSKKDWLNLAIGTLVNIAVAAAFSPTVAKEMIHSFMLAVKPLFDSVLKLLP